MSLNDVFWTNERELLFNILFPLISDAALTGAENAMTDLVETIGVGIDWALVNEVARDWARKYTYDLVGDITDTSREFLQKELDEWIQSGQPLDELIKQIEPMFGKNRAEMIASTEITRAFQSGNVASWKSSGVVDKFIYNTVFDERVCPICEPLNNQEFDLDDNEHSPPLHVRCRCFSKPKVII